MAPTLKRRDARAPTPPPTPRRTPRERCRAVANVVDFGNGRRRVSWVAGLRAARDGVRGQCGRPRGHPGPCNPEPGLGGGALPAYPGGVA